MHNRNILDIKFLPYIKDFLYLMEKNPPQATLKLISKRNSPFLLLYSFDLQFKDSPTPLNPIVVKKLKCSKSNIFFIFKNVSSYISH